MAIVEPKRADVTGPALPVPLRWRFPTARKERYFDPDFFRTEAELLWPQVWQMACRLEEIPRPNDFVEYQVLDQSVIVVRTDDGVRAFQNACRHRGARVVEGRGRESGFTCSFHGWCYGPDGKNTFVPRARPSPSTTFGRKTSISCPCGARCGAGARINLDREAPPLRQCIEPAASALDAWKVGSLRAEWWPACRLPVNWKLAVEAFVESYHVVESHPQLVIPTRYGLREGAPFDRRTFVDADIQYLRSMSEGMAGMVHANDVRIAEGLRDIELPTDPAFREATWARTLNDAVTSWHRDRGADIPHLNELADQGSTRSSSTASRTTSSYRCTAAPRPTDSARSGPRRR